MKERSMTASKKSMTTKVLAVLLATAAMTTSMSAWAQSSPQSMSALQKAQGHFARGDLRATAIELRNALRADPKNLQARLLQAELLLRVGNGQGAEGEIQDARTNGASRDTTRPLMAEAYLLQGRPSDALREADPTLIPASQASETFRVRGLAFAAQREIVKGKQQLALAVRLNPRNLRARLDQARLLGNTGEREAAEKIIDDSLKMSPRHVGSLVFKGSLVRSRPDLAGSLQYFNQALQADPQSPEALMERAATLIDLNREQEARSDMAAISKLMPNHPLTTYLDAVLLARKRKFQEAQAAMATTKGVLDNYPPAALLQGVLAYELNNNEQALGFFDKVLQASPGNAVVQRLKGATQIRQGAFDEALKTLRPLEQASAKPDSRLLALIGVALARKNDFVGSQAYFERAVEAEPNQTAMRTQLALSRIAVGNNAAATRDLQSVLQLEPNSMQALLMLALIDLRSGQYRAAATTSAKIIKTYPNLPLGYNMMGAAQLGLRNPKGAEANFKAALAKQPTYHEARRNLAQLYVTQKRYREARAAYQTVLEQDRNNIKTLVALADLSAVEGKRDEQIEWLRRAAAINNKLLPPRLALVDAYMVSGDRARALAEASALDRDFPNQVPVIETLGRAQAQARDFKSAISTFTRLISATPNSIPAYQLLGRAYASDGQVDQARRTLLRGISIGGPATAGLLIDLVNVEAREGNQAKAIEYANRLRKEFPNRLDGDVTLGQLNLNAKQFASAIRSFEAARKRSFTRQVAIGLSQAHLGLNQIPAAVTVLNQYLARQPTDLVARVALAEVFLKTKNYKVAAQQYELVNKGNTNNPAVLNNLAWVYGKLNDPRAIQYAERAYKLSPTSPEIADTYGALLVERRVDPRRGLQLIQQAVGQRPNDPDMRYHLAMALHANGQTNKARDELRKLLNQFRDFDNAAAAIRLQKLIGG
jgi:cellulose synthase operon protein C